jgi:hypothetical protein
MVDDAKSMHNVRGRKREENFLEIVLLLINYP